jgi:phosphoglucomutase/phosphomannomutase
MMDANQAATAVAEAERSGKLSAPAGAQIRRWLTEPPFAAYRARLLADIEAGNWSTLDNAFYQVLEFGTGGRRGLMYPVGTNVLNERTVAESARGLADYVTARTGAGAPRSCAIARDTRHNSSEFAELCARVLAAAGFRVHLFAEPRSTPLLSAAVRYLKCDAGIMITASHNPPSDNGFKCYAANGGQVVPPDDAGIIACVKAASDREIPEKPLSEAIADGSVVYPRPEVDEFYLNAVCGESVGSARELSIVYTPMHGVGETSVAAALKRAGFERVNILASQRMPDGNFPNVPGHVSNPEIPKTLSASIAEAQAVGADLVLASDPDADRIGVGVPVGPLAKGSWTTLDGNTIGVLLTAFILDQLRVRGKLRREHYLVTTLVTTQMARRLCEQAGIRVEDDLLVGFKWIAERIDQVGPENFLFGFEESHGYLKGTHCRDKDAAVAALLFAELAAELKGRKTSVLAYLDDLYLRTGHFGEHLINKVLVGREGAAQIKTLMAEFRERPPKTLAGFTVTEVLDFKTHEIRPLDPPGPSRPLPRPSGDLLIFHTSAPGTRLAVRPSGTEPKIKLYLFARTPVPDRAALPAAKRKSQAVLDAMAKEVEQYIDQVVAKHTPA